MAPAPLSKLDRAEQDLFLLQHVPHRLCAAATWLELKGKWALPPAPPLPNNDHHVWCIGRSVDEGHYAAMRWLTEFVGVKMARNGTHATRPPPYQIPDQQVTIERFDGGVFFQIPSRRADFLAEIWKGCTQASVHPTRDTNHPKINDRRLARALVIILKHLERRLYLPNGLHLLDVLRTQELRSNMRRDHRRSWISRYKAELAKFPPG